MPLALLLFLICAMTASIVLAAGTVSAGRASNLAEADQAYYSATSAVNLFRDQLAGDDGRGHPVTVAVKADASGNSGTSYTVAVTTDGEAAGSTFSLLERAAIYLLFGGRTATDSGEAQTAAQAVFTSNSAWDSWPRFESFGVGNVGTFAVEHSGVGLDVTQKSALEVQVVASITDDGSLVLTFQKEGDTAGDYLAMFNLTCDADIETGTLETADADAGAEIKYATVTWVPSAVEKG